MTEKNYTDKSLGIKDQNIQFKSTAIKILLNIVETNQLNYFSFREKELRQFINAS